MVQGGLWEKEKGGEQHGKNVSIRRHVNKKPTKKRGGSRRKRNSVGKVPAEIMEIPMKQRTRNERKREGAKFKGFWGTRVSKKQKKKGSRSGPINHPACQDEKKQDQRQGGLTL